MQDAFSRCHPVLNLFYFAVVLGFTMFVQHPVFLIVSFAGATVYAICLNGWRKVLKMNFLLTLPALVIVALLNPLFNHYGTTPLLYLESSGNWVTLEALVYGLVLGCILFIVIEWFSCFNKVMTSDKFVYLFGKLIPALSLILSMALRFVPLFGAQLKVIRNGQKCVGMDVSNGKFVKKIRYGLNLFSILITWALENAIDTADSMKSRGYGLPGRTAFSIYRFDRRDRLMGAALAALFAVCCFGCTQGAAFAQYNPRILIAGFAVSGHEPKVSCGVGVAAATFIAFCAFCFAPALLGFAEQASMKKSRRHIVQEMDVTYRKIYEEMAEYGMEEHFAEENITFEKREEKTDEYHRS